MSRRVLAILVLFAATAQALLGGFDGGVGICIGGSHDHVHDEHTVHEEAASHCAHGCGHHGDMPTPIPGPVPTKDRHNDKECPCTVVELEMTDTFVSARDAETELEFSIPELPAEVFTLEMGRTVTWTGPPPQPDDFPCLRQRMAVVRTTRLLI